MLSTHENNLLKKLRIQFVAMVCSVTALILVASFSLIAWSSHNQKIESVYIELGNVAESALTSKPHDLLGPTPPRIGSREQHTWAFPIALYQIDAHSQVTLLTDNSTAIVADDALEEALSFVLTSEKAMGNVSDAGLLFLRDTRPEGITVVAFADESVAEDDPHLVQSLVISGLIIMLLVFGLALLLSRWALRPVEQAWDQQQQFIADASHEMKTPLTVILANVAIALKKPEATVAEQSQWIEGIQNEAQNMEQLVLDMLVLAQPENAAKRELVLEPVNLSDIAERATLQFEAVAFERGVMMEDDIEPHLSVKAEAAQLQRLAGTLIDNACKYSPRNSTITVTLKSADGKAFLAVHNEGDPIPAEDLPHIFDRFYRADKARDRSSEEGTHSFGLGLAIARKIAEQSGGTLSATSTEADGTTFTAVLPLQ